MSDEGIQIKIVLLGVAFHIRYDLLYAYALETKDLAAGLYVMTEFNDEYANLFRLQYEMIDRLKGETAALQLLLKGVIAEIASMDNGKELVANAFESAMEAAIPLASEPSKNTAFGTRAVGLLDQWRNELNV